MYRYSIALFLLAAFATAPVLTAPLPHFNARSEGGVNSLENRVFSEDISPSFMLRGDTSEQLAARELGHEQHIQSRNLLAGVLARLLNLIGFRIHLRDVTPSELARRDDMDTFTDTHFINSRDSFATRKSGHEQHIQSRNLLAGVLARLLHVIGRMRLRDVTPSELARRNDLDTFIDTHFISSRDSGTQSEIQARSVPDSAFKTVARD